jgi:hypothetical protein
VPPLAELTIEGVGAGAIGALGLTILGGFWLLQKFQDGRKAVVEEVRRELASAREPQAVEVQSPLTVTQHVEFTPIAEHRRLAADFREHRGDVDRRFQAMSDASSMSRQKIYDLIRDQNKAMNDRIDAVPGRTIELLKTARDIQ